MASQFCTKCGTVLGDDGYCTNPNCEEHSSQKQKTSPGTNQSKSSSGLFKSLNPQNIAYVEKGKSIVPDCVQPDVGEVAIRQYDIARLQSLIKGSFAEGRLQVTNKRVIFRATGRSVIGPTCMQQEFSLEEIAGIEIRKEASLNIFMTCVLSVITYLLISVFQSIFYKIYTWGLIGTIVLGLAGVGALLAFFLLKDESKIRHIVLSLLLAAVPKGLYTLLSVKTIASFTIIILFILSLLSIIFAPNLVVSIRTKGGNPSPIEIKKKDGFLSRNHNEYTGFAQVLPGPDVDKAIIELGALIRELQQTGEYSHKNK